MLTRRLEELLAHFSMEMMMISETIDSKLSPR